MQWNQCAKCCPVRVPYVYSVNMFLVFQIFKDFEICCYGPFTDMTTGMSLVELSKLPALKISMHTHMYIWRGVVCIHQNFTFELFLVAFVHLLLWNFQNIYVRYCVGGGFNPILSPNRKCSLLFGCPQENALAVLVYFKTDVLSNLSLLL